MTKRLSLALLLLAVPLVSVTPLWAQELSRDKDEIIGGITNSRVCRFVQYVTRKLNAVFPQGTRRRRWVARLLKLQENDSPQSPARNGKKR